MNKEMVKIPELRFSEFERGFRANTLIEITAGKLSNGIFNDPSKVGVGYYLINVKDMYFDLVIQKENLTKIDIDVDLFNNNKVKYGDVFFTRSSLVKEGIAYSAINLSKDDDITFDGHLIKLTPDFSKIQSMFIGYLLKTTNIRKQLIARGKTGTMTTIGQSDIASVKISIPTLSEQTQIASFLTAVDRRINLLQKKKAELTQYKKGVMQKLFDVKAYGSPVLRFKQDDGSDFPDWEEKKLGEVGGFKNGINKSSSDFGHGVPFVNLMDVFGKSVLKKENFGLVNATEKELTKYNLIEGDVLFIRSSVKRSGVGETIVVNETLEKTVYSGFLIRFRDKNIISKEFKKYCFGSTVFRNQLISMSTTSANTNINQESLNILRIPIPCLPEQQKIANFLSSIDKSIEKIANQIEQSQTWKQGLLQKMFV